MSSHLMDTFIQNFIQKSVQIIVQSRLGTKSVNSKCNPNGKDWFNLDICYLKDVDEQTGECLKKAAEKNPSQSFFFIKSEWKICCEISLRNSDGISLFLEYWVFSNTVFDENSDVQNTNIAQDAYYLMGNMLKSLISLTRATPAYKLSFKGQSADSYVICYRVYECDDNFQSEILDADQLNHFSSIKSLGSIKSICNEISISLRYRTDMNINSESEIKNIAQIDENLYSSTEMFTVKDDHFKKVENNKFDIKDIFQPINPAFASEKTKNDINASTFIDIPFSSLLTETKESSSESLNEVHATSQKSKPIMIPVNITPKATSKSPQIYSTSNESFVFVELNAPFASDDREISSFFNGPSPTFNNSYDETSSDINELTEQLAELESNAPQIDSFVESICITENDEYKLEAY